MNARDSRLSAEERAALAHLEAAATADDPHLATRLRGSGSARLSLLGSKAHRDLSALGARVLGLGWWGLVVAAVGFAMIVLAVSTSLWLGVGGALITVTGLIGVGHAVERRIADSRRGRHEPPPPA
jgi:Protein of unknown function (DUF3040)